MDFRDNEKKQKGLKYTQKVQSRYPKDNTM